MSQDAKHPTGLYARLAAYATQATEGLLNNPSAALDTASRGLREAQRSGDRLEVARFLTLTAHALILSHRAADDQCEKALCEAVDIYKEHELHLGEPSPNAVVALHLLGRLYHHAGRYREGVTLLRSALDAARTTADPQVVAEVFESLAALHADLGDRVRALDYLHEAARLLGVDAPDDILGTLALGRGVLHAEMGSYPEAMELFAEAERRFIASGNDLQRARALGNIAAASLSRNHLDTALDAGLRALALFDLLAMPHDIGRVLATVGSIMERQGRFDQALEYQMLAKQQLEEIGDEQGYLTALLNIGSLHTRCGHAEQALPLLHEALRMAEERTDVPLEYRLHSALSTAYEVIGEPTRALGHARREAVLREEVEGLEKKQAVAMLQIRFEVERAEQEREMYRLKSEALAVLNEQQARELRALALDIVEKNALIESIRRRLANIERSLPSNAIAEVQSLDIELRTHLSADAGWDTFEQQFQRVHSEFIHILSSHYPTLTPTELKVCALLKINLSTKEIAKMLHTSVRNVESRRYWIRKKMGLGTSANLTTHLAGL